MEKGFSVRNCGRGGVEAEAEPNTGDDSLRKDLPPPDPGIAGARENRRPISTVRLLSVLWERECRFANSGWGLVRISNAELTSVTELCRKRRTARSDWRTLSCTGGFHGSYAVAGRRGVSVGKRE